MSSYTKQAPEPKKKMIEGVQGAGSFHINNGGVTFTVENVVDGEYLTGAYLIVGANHMGIQTNQIRIPITKRSLTDLARMLDAAAKEPLLAHCPYSSIPAFTDKRKEFHGCCDAEEEDVDEEQEG